MARVVPGVNVGVPHPLNAAHAVFGNHAAYEDKVTALFGDVEWNIADRLTRAIEARYSWEKKAFEQFSTAFGFALPDNVEASRQPVCKSGQRLIVCPATNSSLEGGSKTPPAGAAMAQLKARNYANNYRR